MPGEFLILSLPRSKSFWLSKILGIGHDTIIGTFRGNSVETGLAPYWRLFPEDMKIVTVRRNVEDVLISLRATGLEITPRAEKYQYYLDMKLNQIEKRWPRHYRVEFDNLDKIEEIRNIARYCGLHREVATANFNRYRNVNLQIDVRAQQQEVLRQKDELLMLNAEAKEAILWQLKRKS